jgi:periplasmic copper chaperone A
MRSLFFIALALALGATTTPALAQEFKGGDITIDKAWVRATPKGAEVGAGYFVIHNNGDTPDRLTGCSADFARVEIHEMKTQNGVMTMPELKNGFDIPAHETVRFTPGGYHVMFNHLTKPLAKGYKVKATLAFEHAGGVEVEFDVEGLGASGPAPTKGDDMGGMKK